MTSRERVVAAMSREQPDRVPLMCQLSIGHYLIHCGVSPADYWLHNEVIVDCFVALADRYGFDGILINLPGRNPQVDRWIDRIERVREGEVVYWKSGGRCLCPKDDLPHELSQPRAALEEIDPEQVFYEDPHTLGGLKYPFHYDLERHLLELQRELAEGSYEPGPYRAFHIRDPKPRLISAAPYRDRVVHHAVCQVVEPIFEASFIHDSYANRVGKGTHKALDRCTHFARRHSYALKCDIRRYFPSMDHEVLAGLIARTIKCPGTLDLLQLIIAHSNPQEEALFHFPGDDLFTAHERRRGLPIGNLTSQVFANVYLNGFDHHVKERLGCRAYLRFVDDFLVFSDDKAWLADLLPQLQGYLDGLRLRLHPRKCQVSPTRCGVEFLGWQVFPDHRRLRRATGIRFQRRLRELAQGYSAGKVEREQVQASVMSWLGHLKHGDTAGLRGKLLGAAAFVRPTPSRVEADPT